VASAVGPAAFPEDACSRREGPPAGVRIGLTGGWAGSTLRLSDQTEADFEQVTATASVSWRLRPTFTLQAGAGALLGGYVQDLDGRHPFDPGLVLQVSGTWLLVAPGAGGPFVAASLGASFLHTTTQAGPAGPSAGFTAADAFVSASAGWSVAPWLSPYLAGKLFGGPVWWERSTGPVTGTDANHYQVALGVVAALPGKFDLLAEVAPLGERAVTVAVGRGF
jgi:hypothetical protein